MKYLEKTKYCLSPQIKHKTNRVFIHQFAYVEKRILKYFNMNNAYLLSIPMVVRSLDPTRNSSRPNIG